LLASASITAVLWGNEGSATTPSFEMWCILLINPVIGDLKSHRLTNPRINATIGQAGISMKVLSLRYVVGAFCAPLPSASRFVPK
jgi:hypothetical protein